MRSVPGSRRGATTAPSVLLLHGNGGSRRNCLGRAEVLALPVVPSCHLAPGPRRLDGRLQRLRLRARGDIAAAVDYLERRRPGRPIVIHGTSLGAAAATFAAGDLGRRVGGYILESPYRDLRTAVRNRIEEKLPPVLDRIAYAGLVATSSLVLPHLDQIAPVDAILAIPRDVPVLILAGGVDRKARPEEARDLQRCVEDHGRLVIFDRAGHPTGSRTWTRRGTRRSFGALSKPSSARHDRIPPA